MTREILQTQLSDTGGVTFCRVQKGGGGALLIINRRLVYIIDSRETDPKALPTGLSLLELKVKAASSLFPEEKAAN